MKKIDYQGSEISNTPCINIIHKELFECIRILKSYLKQQFISLYSDNQSVIMALGGLEMDKKVSEMVLKFMM